MKALILLSWLLQGADGLAAPEEGTVHFRGPLVESEVAAFLDAFPEFDRLHLRSVGGSERAGLMLANAILANGAEVIVEEYCLSACALYPLVAASTVRISEETVIGVHPGAMSVAAATHHLPVAGAHRTSIEAVANDARRLYDTAGVDTRIFLDAIAASGVECIIRDDPQSVWTVSLSAAVWLWVPDDAYWRSIGIEIDGVSPRSVSEAEERIGRYVSDIPPFTFGGGFPGDTSQYDFSGLAFCNA